MGKREGGVVEVDRTADDQDQPVLVLALGRGKTGKSTFIRWASEASVSHGASPMIADADRTNATLAAFFEGVERPPSPEDEDVRLWLNGLIDRQIEERFSGFLDLGGGDLLLKQWARDLELSPFLEANGVSCVAVHFLTSDMDDLAYLRDMEEGARFQPARTALVLNEGLVPPGRSAATAFGPIIEHDVFRKAVARGAVPVRMPRLACMHEIDQRRLSFEDAAAGRVKAGQEKIGAVNRQLISIWRREMATAFARVQSWMP